EAELLSHPLDLGRSCILRDVEQRRVTRQTEQQEQRGVDAEDHDEQVDGAPCDQADHERDRRWGSAHPIAAWCRYMLHSGLNLTPDRPLARALMLGCSYSGMCRTSSHSTSANCQISRRRSSGLSACCCLKNSSSYGLWHMSRRVLPQVPKTSGNSAS